MRTFAFRAIVVSTVVTVSLVPLYAHHGTPFLSKAMEANTAEVQFAEMAANKSQDQRIKDYAQMLVRDHNQAVDKIKELQDYRLANSLSTTGQVDHNTAQKTGDIQLTPEHQRTYERLSMLSGAAFDRAFIDLMVREHQQAIREFEEQSHAHGYTISSSKQPGAASGQTARAKPGEADQKKYSQSELRRDVDTAEFANATLPTLRQHLNQAEEIQRTSQTK